MAESPRPTREQVDAELARVDDPYVCTDDRHRLLAAGVRALRAELESHHASLVEALELGERGGGGEWTWDEFRAYIAKAKGGLAMTNETVRRRTAQLAEAFGHPAPHEATWPEALRAALAARAPQPAEPTTGDLLRAAATGRREYAQSCGGTDNRKLQEMHDALLTQAATLDGAARLADGDMGPLYDWLPSWRWTPAMEQRVKEGTSTATTRADAAALAPAPPQHAVPDGRSYDQLTEQEGGPPNERLPLYAPAVPDGEDAPAPLSDLDARQVAAVPALLAMCDEAEQLADGLPFLTTREVRRAVAAAVPGEDVPALLRSLADRWDRQQATYPDTAHGRAAAAAVRLCAREVRAAVAAALARPADRCTPGHCDRCIPGPTGEHISVLNGGQLPCVHTGGDA